MFSFFAPDTKNIGCFFKNTIMLQNLKKIIKNLENVKQIQNEVVSNVLRGSEEEISDLQRSQFWNGKNKLGENLRPYYSEDEYFKTPESAKKYSDWKKRISKNDNRYFDAPNLYINGYFYSKIKTNIDFSSLRISTTNSFSDKIGDKYDNLLGLNDYSMEKIFIKYGNLIRNRIIKKIYGG